MTKENIFLCQVIKAPYNRVFPAEDDLNHDVDDNCKFAAINDSF